MIVKHRRGTTQEWQELNLHVIPEAGELIIEECKDGTRKCKIGTGFTRFSELPYINDETKAELLFEISVVKEQLTTNITNLNKTFIKELKDIETELSTINTKCYELTNDYITRDANLKTILTNNINDAVELLRSDISSVAEYSEELQVSLQNETTTRASEVKRLDEKINTSINELETSLNTECNKLTNDYIARDTNLKTRLTQDLNDAVELLRSEIASIEDSSKNGAQADIARLDAELKTVKKNVDDITISNVEALEVVRNELTTDYTTRDANLKAIFDNNISEVAKQLRTEAASLAESFSTADAQLQSDLANIEMRLATAQANFNTALADIISNFNTRCLEIAQDYTTRDNNLKITLTQEITKAVTLLSDEISTAKEFSRNAEQQLQDEIEQVETKQKAIEDEFNRLLNDTINSFNTKYTEFFTDYVARDANIQKLLTDQLTGIETALRSDLNAMTESLKSIKQTEIADIYTKISAVERDSAKALEDKAEAFTIIHDEILATCTRKDADLKAILDSDLAKAIELLTTKINSVSEYSSGIQTKLLAKTEQINSKIADTEAKFTSAIANITNNSEIKYNELTNDYISRDANLSAILTTKIEESAETIQAELQKETSRLESETTSIKSDVASLEAELTTGLTSCSDKVNHLDESFKQLHNETKLNLDSFNNNVNGLTSKVKEINDTVDEVTGTIDEINEAVDEITDTLKIKADKTAIDDLQSTLTQKIAEVSNKIYEYEGDPTNVETFAKPLEPNPGDILVIKDKTFGIKSVYSYDKDCGWVACNGNVSASNVILKKNITLAGDFDHIGNLTKEFNGNKTLETAGLSVEDFLTSLLTKRIQPNQPEQPKVVLALTNLTNTSYEVGTTLQISYSATLDPGSYTYGPATDVQPTSWNIKLFDGNMVIETRTTPTGTFDTAFTMEDTTELKVEATATYSAGTKAVDNLGELANPEIFIAADTASVTSPKISSYRNYFYGYSTNADVDMTSADNIRSLLTAAKTKPTTITTTDMQQISVAIPSAENITSVEITNAITTAPAGTVRVKRNVLISGANNYNAITYDVFYVTNAVAETGTTSSWKITYKKD